MENIYGQSGDRVHVSRDSSLMGSREWVDVNAVSFYSSTVRYDGGALTSAALHRVEVDITHRIEELLNARAAVAALRVRLAQEREEAS